MSGPIAIVSDGMWRKSLSAIRSLGKAGYEVHVLGDSWFTTGFWSRFTAARAVMADAADHPEAFERAFVAYLRGLTSTPGSPTPGSPRPVLLPMEDATLRFVVAHQDALAAWADFIVPSPTAFATCSDKAATMALAATLGIPHPATEAAGTADALLAAVGRMTGREFIVKPTAGAGSRGVQYNPVFDAASAAAYLQRFGPAIVQERIAPEGEARGVSLLFDRDGRVAAHFCHKRLRQFPNSGGPSTDRVGIDDQRLLEMSVTLLTAIGWRGVAMVEWKIDPRSGEPKLLEVNPRFWGSLELAVRSGVDFPVLYAKAASGASAAHPRPTIGVRCRWLIPGDVLRWLSAASGERESMGAFLRGLPAAAEEWDPRDLPGLAASVVCQGVGVLRPKYRKMLDR